MKLLTQKLVLQRKGKPNRQKIMASPVNKLEDENSEIKLPSSPDDIHENIKSKFLVTMPEDFFHFWEFCKSMNAEKPQDALKNALGIELVGPFDILGKKLRNIHVQKPSDFLRHWRYYYDPPEFQTVFKGDNKTQYHLGYFRDEPGEPPVFVAANSATRGCKITPVGDNLFAAVNVEITKVLQTSCAKKMKDKLLEIQETLKKWADKHHYSLETKTMNIKKRNRKIVTKTFHGAGIVVPVDSNNVGYRPLPETNSNLKNILARICDSKTDKERDRHLDDLHEIMTLVQFANDECDYGMGFELGMDLFCYGDSRLHPHILNLLPLACDLLGRNEFGKILEAHLSDRKYTPDLSVLS
ncbi:histone PARylation factor 1-like [Tachypleus tridentatus]|uniref:histone PARylation factor 1-like n=1 Tax=Tachypleus tridentatus TaxID=6853 RepID=UPI003FD3C06D